MASQVHIHQAAKYSLEDWTRTDNYHKSFLLGPDEVLEHTIKTSRDNGLPEIAVSPAQGKHLNLVARSIGAKRILELGTLGGYSTICLARALPSDGELVTCELREKCAEVARGNIEYAGLSSKVTVVVGPASESLAKMDPSNPFDLIFIDADNASYPTYFTQAKRLVRKGGVIFVDNVVWEGEVSDLSITDDASVNGVREMLALIKNDKEIDATTIATVGEKGYDGFLYALRL